jgi:single-strand DNA-binding protein
MDLNKVQIIGNNTKDIELKTTPNGMNVTSFSVATNRNWTD